MSYMTVLCGKRLVVPRTLPSRDGKPPSDNCGDSARATHPLFSSIFQGHEVQFSNRGAIARFPRFSRKSWWYEHEVERQ